MTSEMTATPQELQRRRRLLAVVWVIFLVGVFPPLPVEVAKAGQYTVTTCDAPNHAWVPFGDTSPTWHTGQACPVTSFSNGLFVGHTFNYAAQNSGAGWATYAPAGNTIVATSQSFATQGNYNGDIYHLGLYTNTGLIFQCDSAHQNCPASRNPHGLARWEWGARLV